MLEYENECDIKYCLKETCKSQNIDCGFGTCINTEVGYDCICEEGKLHKYEDTGKKCTENICSSSKDCRSHVMINGEKRGMKLCLSNGTCGDKCNNSSDCIGETEFCAVYTIDRSETEYYDYYKCEEISSDIERCENYNKYLYLYSNKLECKDFCTKNSCASGFRCNHNNHCTPPICLNDQDCINDKFSEGNTCNTELNYCE